MIGLSNQAHKDNRTWLQILILSIMEIGFNVFCKTVQEISGLKMIYDGYILKASTAVPFRGPEGVLIWLIMEIDFMVFFWKRGMISTSCFLPHENILILAKVIASWRSAHMCNSIVRAIFRRDFPQMKLFQTSKSIFSYNFWAIISKLSGYVLGM